MEEIRGQTPDGRELVLELSAIPLKDENGQTTGVFVTHRDVTDESRLKARYLEEQAEHKDDDGLRGLVREDLRDLGLLRDLRGVVFLILLEHFFKFFLLP